MKSKILITGAAGFIGSHLVDYLLEEGYPVDSLRLLILKDDSLDNLPNKNFDIIRGDVRDKVTVKKALEGVKIVYHLAALTIGGNRYKDTEYREVNIKGTQNTLDGCRDKNIQKFIFFSSIAVFGLPALKGDMINLDERAPKQPREIYGQTKLEAERRVVRAHKKWKIPYAIIRPTTVYGPKDKGNLTELYKAIKKHYFFFIGDGENKMDYVYIKDVVRAAYLTQLNRLQASDYIIGAERAILFKEVVRCVAKSINQHVPKLHIPKSVGLALSYLTQFAGKVLGRRSPLFPSRVKVMTTSCYFNTTKARKELKFRPKVSFKEGTHITGKWLLENGVI